MFSRLLFVLGILLVNVECQRCPSTCRSKISKIFKRIKSLENQMATLKSENVDLKSEDVAQKSQIIAQKSQIIAQKSKIDALESQIVAISSAGGNGGGNGGGGGSGAVYTRWGRTTCPENNAQLYEGFAGGSHYSHSGGGANYLCLPREPQFANVKDGAQGCGSYIYGAEYEVGWCGVKRDILLFDNTNVNNFQNHDVPCAVCQATNRQSRVFIPARTECPKGWVEEYQGYVMGEYHGHKRSEWVCMDLAPETRAHGDGNKDGALFYLAEAKCGTLPCPPYKEGSELPCVVCTK